MPVEGLTVEDKDGVRWVKLHRPDSRNGLTPDTAAGIGEAFASAADDPAVRVSVLFGEGGAFCSGLDLKSVGGMPENIGKELKKFHAGVKGVYRLMKPTIAAIDGAAAGFGADLALACDVRIGSPRARLGERFVRIGLVPDGGGTFMLPRLLGPSLAYDLIYSGRMVESDEMLRIGLLGQLIKDDNFQDAVHAIAATMAKGPPLAYAAAKRALQAGLGDFDAALQREGDSQLKLLQSQDFMEGIAAFLEKREPNFQGK